MMSGSRRKPRATMTTCSKPNYLEILRSMMAVSIWHIFHKPPTEGAARSPARPPGASAPGRDGRVHGVADHVQPRAVPRVRHAAVRQVGERHARVRVSPAVGRPHAAVAERPWRGDGAEP